MNDYAPLKSLYHSYGFLLVFLLAGCNQIPVGLEAVTPFDIQRYKGHWYEVMRLDNRFERGLSHVTATYDLRNDGTVSVLNRGFNNANCEWEEARGVAVFQKKKLLVASQFPSFGLLVVAITSLILTVRTTTLLLFRGHPETTYGSFLGNQFWRRA